LIAQLSGRILRKSPQDVVLDVHGVGYRVLIPVSTFYRLGAEAGEASLRIYTHVREDALQLYGFASETEQALFERLIDVAGVGPKLAINILSGIEAADLVQALRGSDVARLTRIPGVGKKTAERLVVELRDKMPQVLEGGAEASAPAAQGGIKDDLVSALANLGYARGDAEKGVERALRDAGGGRFEDLLRRSLRVLSGR
jgi:Holliday junction DNA helicase RuvA